MTLTNFNLVGFSLAGLLSLSSGCKDKGNAVGKSFDKPNILIIVSDDMGWSDIGYHGSEIKTPNLDKLAKTGLRMEQHYVMPTCTPTRVSLLTGKYPSRYGITAPAYGEVIDTGDPTMASVLKNDGYYTAIAGKWHLGSPPYTPLKYGFRSSYGYFTGQIDPYTHEYKQETALTGKRSWHRNDVYFDEEGHVTDLLTTEAIRIIEERREEPFFLYLAHHVPHYPLDEPDEWKNVYKDMDMFPSRKLFAASVTHMDNAVGEIIEALERTGKREHTLILFISDNGGQHNWHNEENYGGKYADKPHHVLGNNYPLRGWKEDLYEGGIRVPAFINWAGKIMPGIMDAPIHVSDWFPTICHIVGCQSSIDPLPLDGQNILPFLTGKQKKQEKRTMYWKTDRSSAVREGDWKLLVHRDTDEVELFNLENDFRETRNLNKANPEKTKYLLKLMNELKKHDRN